MAKTKFELNMIIDCISDLHGHYPKLEGGDLLIVAGDLTGRDSPRGYSEILEWFKKLDYKKIIAIAGNHDNLLYRGLVWGGDDRHDDPINLEYLCDSGTEFQELKIWGSPWTKWFPEVNPRCTAFMLKTEEQLAQKWALIPDDTDILVTHGPAFTIRDGKNVHEYLGSTSLLKKISKMNCLKLHIFGHIHEGYGLEGYGIESVIHVNASHVNERYEPVNKPVRVVL